ncbi:MAG: hypothetical protein AABY22_33680 [Nanoarchaeota archaeon]
MLKIRNKDCFWKENMDGWWETTCKNIFEFTNYGPRKNGFRFCPYCGKLLRQKSAVNII